MSISRHSEAILRSFVERAPYDVSVNLPLEPADEDQNNAADEEPDDGESGYESDIEPRVELEENEAEENGGGDYEDTLGLLLLLLRELVSHSGLPAEFKNDNMQYFDRRTESECYVGNVDSVQDKSLINDADRTVHSAQDRFYYSGLSGGGYDEKRTDDKELGSDGESDENNRSRSMSGRAGVEAEYPGCSGSSGNDETPATVFIALADGNDNGEPRHSDTDSETTEETDAASYARSSQEHDENSRCRSVTGEAFRARVEADDPSCRENNADNETSAEEVFAALTDDDEDVAELRLSGTDSYTAENRNDEKESRSGDESDENNRSRSVSGRPSVATVEDLSCRENDLNDAGNETRGEVSVAMENDSDENSQPRHSNADSHTADEDATSCAHSLQESDASNPCKSVTGRAFDRRDSAENPSCRDNDADGKTSTEVYVTLENDNSDNSERRNSHRDSATAEETDATSCTRRSLENNTYNSLMKEETTSQAGDIVMDTTWTTTMVSYHALFAYKTAEIARVGGRFAVNKRLLIFGSQKLD